MRKESKLEKKQTEWRCGTWLDSFWDMRRSYFKTNFHHLMHHRLSLCQQTSHTSSKISCKNSVLSKVQRIRQNCGMLTPVRSRHFTCVRVNQSTTNTGGRMSELNECYFCSLSDSTDICLYRICDFISRYHSQFSGC